MKLCAFLGVVVLHTLSTIHYGDTDRTGIETVAQVPSIAGEAASWLARFAVPCFLSVSGYLFAHKLANGFWPAWRSLAWKLGVAYIGWVLAYNLPIAQKTFTTPLVAARTLLSGGAGGHLWFLPALTLGLLALRALYLIPTWRMRWTVVALFYGAAIVTMAYPLLWRADPLPYSVQHVIRMSPAITLPFLAFGAWMAEGPDRPTMHWALPLAALGAAGVIAECIRFGENEFMLSSIPYGFGVFALFLQWRPGPRTAHVLMSFATFGLGYYAVHMAYVDLMVHLIAPTTILGRLSVALVVVALTVPTTLLLARLRPLRSFLR